jgi:hypothetical protein
MFKEITGNEVDVPSFLEDFLMSGHGEPVQDRNRELSSAPSSRSGGGTISGESTIDRAASPAGRFFEIGTIVTSLAAIAYLVGYLTAKAYFDEFRAGWLVGQISSRDLLTYSLVPLGVLVFFIYLGITDLAEGGKSREKAAYFVVAWTPLTIIVWLVLESITSYVWRPSAAISFIGFILAIFLAGAVVEVTVLQIKYGRTKLGIHMLYIAYAVVFLALYVGPTRYGRSLALMDMEHHTTRLPAIELRNPESDEKTYLLLVEGDTYFCVQFSSAPCEHSTILPRSRDEIKSIAPPSKRTGE